MLISQKIIDILNKGFPFFIHSCFEGLQKSEPIQKSLFVIKSFAEDGHLNFLNKESVFIDSLFYLIDTFSNRWGAIYPQTSGSNWAQER